jgi:membrane protein
MITMVLSSLISLFNKIITQYFGFETYMLVEFVNFSIGFGLVMLLFALMFKVLPDVQITWKSVWRGAFLTTILFTLGKFLLSLYFNQVKPTSAFGAAGTVILIMMWINYSCMLIFSELNLQKYIRIKKAMK